MEKATTTIFFKKKKFFFSTNNIGAVAVKKKWKSTELATKKKWISVLQLFFQKAKKKLKMMMVIWNGILKLFVFFAIISMYMLLVAVFSFLLSFIIIIIVIWEFFFPETIKDVYIFYIFGNIESNRIIKMTRTIMMMMIMAFLQNGWMSVEFSAWWASGNFARNIIIIIIIFHIIKVFRRRVLLGLSPWHCLDFFSTLSIHKNRNIDHHHCFQLVKLWNGSRQTHVFV